MKNVLTDLTIGHLRLLTGSVSVLSSHVTTSNNSNSSLLTSGILVFLLAVHVTVMLVLALWNWHYTSPFFFFLTHLPIINSTVLMHTCWCTLLTALFHSYSVKCTIMNHGACESRCFDVSKKEKISVSPFFFFFIVKKSKKPIPIVEMLGHWLDSKYKHSHFQTNLVYR